MVFNDPFYDEHLIRNPNDFRYQSEPSTWADNLKFNIQTAISTGAQNLQIAIDNAAQNLKMAIENSKQNINEDINQYGNQEPLFKLDLNPPVTQNNIIHEELAEKERRIRYLESIQVEHTNKISQLETEKLEERKKIKELEKKLEKLQNNPFLKWMMRATEDCKKEKIF